MKKIIIGGILVSALAFICIRSINSVFGMVPVHDEEKFEVDGIEMLNIQTTAADVEIQSDLSDHITVKLEGKIDKKLKEKFRLNTAEDGKQLNISYLSNDNSLGFKLGSERDVTLKVTLPERTYKELLVHTTSGDIDAVSVSAGTIKIKSTSGNQYFSKFNSEDTISMKSTSGNVEIDGLVSKSGKMNTKSGNIAVKIEEMINGLDVVTTSGDVKVAFSINPKSLKINFRGGSGKPNISLKDFKFENNNKNSAVGVIGDGSKTLNVKTTSGDFTAIELE